MRPTTAPCSSSSAGKAHCVKGFHGGSVDSASGPGGSGPAVISSSGGIAAAGGPSQKSRTPLAGLKLDSIQGRLGMGKILASLVFGVAVLGVASSEASAMNFVCQAAGPRSVAYGRAFFVADAKWQALLRCERYSGVCIITYCVPTY